MFKERYVCKSPASADCEEICLQMCFYILCEIVYNTFQILYDWDKYVNVWWNVKDIFFIMMQKDFHTNWAHAGNIMNKK